jgi:hypothetical protein
MKCVTDTSCSLLASLGTSWLIASSVGNTACDSRSVSALDTLRRRTLRTEQHTC